MNDGMLTMITLKTEYTQLEERNNFLSCCVLAAYLAVGLVLLSDLGVMAWAEPSF